MTVTIRAGDLSLREATELARGSVLTADSITFAAVAHQRWPGHDLAHARRAGDHGRTVDHRSRRQPTDDRCPRQRSDARTLKNGDGSRVFNIGDDDNEMQFDVSISGLTLTGGDVGDFDGGGAIRNLENLTVSSSTISGNAAFNGSGGGIHSGYSYYGDVTAEQQHRQRQLGWKLRRRNLRR